jgi:hypothetical protein
LKKFNERVARRIAALSTAVPAENPGEGVTPLAAGYFRLEQLRNSVTPRQNNEVKVRSSR